jgi:hypothetical protein
MWGNPRNSSLASEASTAIIGLRVIMADDCTGFLTDGLCLSREAIIGDQRELWCATCGALRKKLSARAAAFIAEIISKFRCPDGPIALRRSIGYIRSPDLLLPRDSNSPQLKRRYRKMDMRQYGQTYLQPVDLLKTKGKRQGTIEEIRPPESGAKYPKPILLLTDGKLVLLNKASVGNLMQEFGFDSADWVGRSVLLTYQSDTIDGKDAAWINVTPLTNDAA